jgi:hypothetical protein
VPALPAQFDQVNQDTADNPLANTVSDPHVVLSGTETDTETETGTPLHQESSQGTGYVDRCCNIRLRGSRVSPTADTRIAAC